MMLFFIYYVKTRKVYIELLRINYYYKTVFFILKKKKKNN